jgi:hypothetical protein
MAAPAEVPQPVERLFAVYKTRFPVDHPQHREVLDGLTRVVDYVRQVVYTADSQIEIPQPDILEEDPFGFAVRGQLQIVRTAFDRQRRAEASGVTLRTPEVVSSTVVFRQLEESVVAADPVSLVKKKLQRQKRSRPTYIPPDGFVSVSAYGTALGISGRAAWNRYHGLPSAFRGDDGKIYVSREEAEQKPVRGSIVKKAKERDKKKVSSRASRKNRKVTTRTVKNPEPYVPPVEVSPVTEVVVQLDAVKAAPESPVVVVSAPARARTQKKEAEWISQSRIKSRYGIDTATIVYIGLDDVPKKESVDGTQTYVLYNAKGIAQEMEDFREPPRVDRETGTFTDPIGGIWATTRHAKRVLGISAQRFGQLTESSVTSMPVIDLNGGISWAFSMAELRLRLENVQTPTKKDSSAPLPSTKESVGMAKEADGTRYVSIGLILDQRPRIPRQTMKRWLASVTHLSGYGNNKKTFLYDEAAALAVVDAKSNKTPKAKKTISSSESQRNYTRWYSMDDSERVARIESRARELHAAGRSLYRGRFDRVANAYYPGGLAALQELISNSV